MTEINEAIENLKEEIKEKENLIEKLTQFSDLGILTEDDYHTYCETDMRYTDTLGQALLGVFPFLEYDSRGANYFYYKIKDEDIRINIPNSRVECVEMIFPELIVDLKHSLDSLNNYNAPTRYELEFKKIKKILSTKNIFKRAKLINPKVPMLIAPIVLLNFRHRKRYLEGRMVYLEDKLNEMQSSLDYRNEVLKFTHRQQRQKIAKYVSQLLEWTTVVYVRPSDGAYHSSLKCTMENGKVRITNPNLYTK